MKNFITINKKINFSLRRLFIKVQMKNFAIIGVDMGGTNSYIAMQEPNGPRIIENAEGNEK